MDRSAESVLPAGADVGKSSGPPLVVNSMSHPNAWQWLNRNCKPDKGVVPKEVYEDWVAGGARRQKLLYNFVTKVHQPGASQQTNALRLEAFVRFRQCSKDFSKSLAGYSWKTESEMKDDLHWSESLRDIYEDLFAAFLRYTLCMYV